MSDRPLQPTSYLLNGKETKTVKAAITTGSTRIDQLEALAQTILLAIDQLRQRQEASHQTFQQELQAEPSLISELTRTLNKLLQIRLVEWN